MLTNRTATVISITSATSSMEAIKAAARRRVGNSSFSEHKARIKESITALVDTTNAAIEEHFREPGFVESVQRKITNLNRKIKARAGKRRLKRYDDHLAALTKMGECAENDVPVFLSGENALAIVELLGTHQCKLLADMIDDGKELFENQIRTMVRLLFYVLMNPKRAGLIVGALQSGKTGIGMAIKLLMAPMLYLLTGVRIYPHFISTNQWNHVQQSNTALEAAVALYGHVEIFASRDHMDDALTVSAYLDSFHDIMDSEFTRFRIDNKQEHANFVASPTVGTYKNTIARLNGATDDDEISKIDEIMIRSPGGSVEAVRRLIELAERNNFYLLLILDEPQYGSSGDFAHINAKGKLRGGVLNQMFFDSIKKIISPNNMHMLVGLSASPFGLTDADRLFTLHAYVPENYFGPNCFDGDVLDSSKPWGLAAAPTIYDWDSLESASGIAGAGQIRDLLIAKAPRRKKGDPVLSLEQQDADRKAQRIRGGKLLNKLVRAMVSDPSNPEQYGVLLRACKTNELTAQMANEAKLSKYFTLVHFYNKTEALSANLKGELKKYRREAALSGKPVLILITARGRMADSFPNWVEFFMDFTAANGDMNSKLQGVFGRACGVNKPYSKVFVNSLVANDLRRYILSNGSEKGAKSSPHVVRTNSHLREDGNRSQCAILGVSPATARDLKIKEFLARIEDALELTEAKHDGITDIGANTRLDITAILRDTDLINYVNDNWKSLFPKASGRLITLDDTRNYRGKRLVWPTPYMDEPNVIIRHSTPGWYANPANHKRSKHYTPEQRAAQSFETHNRYYLADRKSRLPQKTVREDKLILRRGDSHEIDAVLDAIAASAVRGGKLATAPKVKLNGLLARLKKSVEEGHSTLFPGRFSKVTLVATKRDKWRNKYKGSTVEFGLDITDDGLQMLTLNLNSKSGESAARVVAFQQHVGLDKDKVFPQVLHRNGVVEAIAWPANADQQRRNHPGEANLNIQINLGKFDSKGREIISQTKHGGKAGRFRVTAICLPLMEQMAPSYAGETDIPNESSFVGDAGLSPRQKKDRAATIIANGGQPRRAPKFPVPVTKPIKGRRKTGKGRMNVVTI
jgi:hypothetical protein